MSYDSDYSHDWDSGHSGHGRHSSYSGSSHSSSGKKDIKLDTEKLVSTMIDDQGRISGIQVSKDLADKVRTLLPMILIFAASKGTDVATKQWGPFWGKVTGSAIALSTQIADTVQNIYELVSGLNSLSATMKPLSKAAGQNNSIAALTDKNEVLASARTKFLSLFTQRMVETLISVINAVPALLTVFSKTDAEAKKHESIKELEAANGDPKKIKEVYENQLHGGGKTGSQKGLSGAQLRQGEELLIAERLENYTKEYTKYRNDNLEAVKKNMIAEVSKLNPSEYEVQLVTLRNMGVPTETLVADIKDITARTPEKRNQWRRNRLEQKDYKEGLSLEEDLKLIIDRFKSSIGSKNNANSVAETIIKKQFVAKNRPFNRDWKTYADGNQDTIEEELRRDIKKLNEANANALKEQQEKAASPKEESGLLGALTGKGKEIWQGTLALGGGILSSVVLNILGGKAMDHYKKPIAADRISHLIKCLDSQGESNWELPKQVPPILNSHNGRSRKDDDGLTESVSYARYIHEIFQQHQRDNKWAEVGGRFTQKLEDAGWRDEAIQKIPDEELNAYEFAVKTIARRIMDKRMAAAALVYLVGDPNGNKIVHADGRSFGPRKAGKDEASVKAAILSLIDEYSATVQAEQKISVEQFSERMSNFAFGSEELKAKMEDKTVELEQRVFAFRGFSDVIGSDEKICSEVGITKERCQELRKASQKAEYGHMLDAVVEVLAELSERHAKILDTKPVIVTEKDIDLIQSLVRHEREAGRHVDDFAGEKIEQLKTLATNAVMKLSNEAVSEEAGAKTFWQSVKDKAEELKTAPPEHKKEERSKTSRKTARDSDDRNWENETDFGNARQRYGSDMDSQKPRFGDRKNARNGEDAWNSHSEDQMVASHGAPDGDELSEGRFSKRFAPGKSRHDKADGGKTWTPQRHGEEGHGGRERHRRSVAKASPAIGGEWS